jgi:hypothetical protein
MEANVLEWVPLANPVLALAINCAVYLVFRRVLGSSIAVSILGGLSVGMAAILGLAAKNFYDASVDAVELMIFDIGTYLPLSFCFWAFLNLNITSLRIRVIRHLLRAKGTADLSDLLSQYSDVERLNRRLKRLSSSGQIELVDGRWQVRSSTVLVVARCVEVLRTILLGGRAGT